MNIKRFEKSFYFFVLTVALNPGWGFVRAAYSDGLAWPQYLGPDRDGVCKETGWLTAWPKAGLEFLWKKSIGVGFASMAVVDGRVYAMGHKIDAGQENEKEKTGVDSVFCFDTESGNEIWHYSYACKTIDNLHEGGPAATPAVADGIVYTFSKEGHLFALDALTGEVKWSKKVTDEYGAKVPTWGFAGSPLILGDAVIIDAGIMLAFKRSNGELLWKSDVDYGSAYASPVPFAWQNKTSIATLPECGLVILNADDGKEIVKYEWKTAYGVNAGAPIVSGNRIFISTGYNAGCTVVELQDDGTLKEVWKSKIIRNHMDRSTLWNGYLYGIDEDILRCVDWNTGKEAWSHKGFGKGTQIVADGRLIVLSDRGELAIAKAAPEGFEEMGRIQALGGKCWTKPVLSGSKLFCRNAQGDLVCLDVSRP